MTIEYLENSEIESKGDSYYTEVLANLLPSR